MKKPRYLLCAIILFLGVTPFLVNLETHGSYYANFGSFISGLTALVGIPFLLYGLFLQRVSLDKLTKQQLDADLENAFESRCKSIDVGLSYIKNINDTDRGGSAIIRYGALCVTSKIHNQALNELTPGAILGVVAGLIELERWMFLDKRHLRFRPFFRARYMSIVVALENFIPEQAVNNSEAAIKRNFLNDQSKLSLYLAINTLKILDGDVDVKFEEEYKDKIAL